MKNRLIRLLESWAEREVILILGRALIIPETTYRWGPNKLGVLVPVSEGVCWERCTATRQNSILDEFGCAIRSIEEQDQGLIIVDHFGGVGEWEELLQYYGISRRDSEPRLRIAWSRLIVEAIRRDLL